MTQSAKEFFQSLKENPELGKQFDAELKKMGSHCKSRQGDGIRLCGSGYGKSFCKHAGA